MDARRPTFLAEHVDFDASSFDVAGGEAILNGVLRAPSQKCLYIARADVLVATWHTRFRLELDMHVSELADLELRMDDLRETPLTTLWIDEPVRAAWGAIVDRDVELELRHGNCVLVATLEGGGVTRMRGIVALMCALADAPARRAAELAEAVAHHGLVHVPPRLALGGDGLVITGDIVVGASYRRRKVHTTVHAVGQPDSAVDLEGWVVDRAQLDAAIAQLATVPAGPYR